MLDKNKLRIAIQKSGRLSKESQSLFNKSGIKINLKEDRLIAFAENMPIDILRVRDDDIPGLVFDGIVDLGIVGENVLEEKMLNRQDKEQNNQYIKLKKLDFGNCRLSIATPNNFSYSNIQDLNNKMIATSYPNLLKRYLADAKVNAKICLLNGSVEVAPRSGISDAICDLVSSGATLEANDLREVEVIFNSTACLIQKQAALSSEKQELVNKLLMRFDGILQARESKYIMLHSPKDKLEEIIKLLPGVEKPTILSLAEDPAKIALHMVSRENLFWETMEQLKELGASSILVLPIEKMMK